MGGYLRTLTTFEEGGTFGEFRSYCEREYTLERVIANQRVYSLTIVIYYKAFNIRQRFLRVFGVVIPAC